MDDENESGIDLRNFMKQPKPTKQSIPNRKVTAKPNGKWTTKKMIIVGVSAIILMVFAFGMTYMDAVTAPPSPFANLPVETVHGIFVDINGDGRLDYVVEAKIILNPSDKPNFPHPTQTVR